jgi:hypothetical protein
MLDTPNNILLYPDGSGILPHGYKVEFAPILLPTSFASGPAAGTWQQREVVLSSIEIGYGADAYSAYFTMFDPNTVEAPYLSPDKRDSRMTVPTNGELVRIWNYNRDTKDYDLVFKGTIKSVHDRKDESGTKYIVTAHSEVVRLDESFVTFTSNLRNDPFNPSPIFNGQGYLVGTVLRTVKDLVEQVLAFPDTWNKPQYFTSAMIDWNGLDTDLRCGLFKPSNIVFSDTPKGQAIQQILQAAGNFTFLYVPGPDGSNSDKLVIAEHNLKCNKCGDKWNLPFASPDKANPAYVAPYASAYRIKSDLTQWSSTLSATSVRMTSGPIRFYGGHFLIPERLDPEGDPGADTRNMIVPAGDTFAAMDKRSRNFEQAYYRFIGFTERVLDVRKQKQMIVGMPLFPDWNVHEDYLPDLVRINGVRLNGDNAANPTGFTTTGGQTATYAGYAGLAEWSMRTIGDAIATGGMLPGRTHNLRVWQAWYCKDDCPACNGSGAVKKVYNNADNEPTFSLWAVGPTGTRQLTGNSYAIAANEVMEARVENYLFDPKKFGERDPNTGLLYPPTSLTPFDPTDQGDPVVQKTGGYPVPWKNLCPYCRGTGKKPEWKIRNIEPELFDGRNYQAATDITNVSETPLDPEATSVGPEQWEQTQNRIMFRQQAFVQVEAPLGVDVPEWQYRNKNLQTLKSLTEAANAQRGNSSTADASRLKLPHPLQFKNVTKLLAPRFGVTGADAKVVPDEWYTIAQQTTINVVESSESYQIDYKMGRVIFSRPQFISCTKQFQAYRYEHRRHIVEPSGLLSAAPRPQLFSDDNRWHGYWRPARVWGSFFYVRDHYYDTGWKDPAGVDVPTVSVTHVNDDNEQNVYKFRSMIIDGRYVMEVQKVTSDSGELSGDDRIIQACFTDDAIPIETSEDDYWKMPVPPQMDIADDALEALKVTQGLTYPRGKLLTVIMTTTNEQFRELDGVSSQDFNHSVLRPRIFTWRMRDGRLRLMNLAVRRLELANNLTVSGKLECVGVWNNFHKGLGYVDYPNKGLATVKRVTYSYDQGFETSLELAREHARLGELPPSAEQVLDKITKTVNTLSRNPIDIDSNTAARLLGTNGRHNQTDDNGAGAAPVLFFDD